MSGAWAAFGDPSIPQRWICNVMKSSRAEGGENREGREGRGRSILLFSVPRYGFYRHVKKQKEEEKKT
jgi:hypothetical protein